MYHVHTLRDIHVHVCTYLYIYHKYTDMYIHVHVCRYVHTCTCMMYMYILACTYMFMLQVVRNFVNMYIHVFTMYRDVCTDLPILVQVVRIPDDVS
jgi:hypothetical protein